MTKVRQLEEKYVRIAEQLAAELRESWPIEFTLGCRLHENGRPVFPNLVFHADPEIPGLYRAEVDPDLIMGRRSSRELPSVVKLVTRPKLPPASD